MAKQFWVNFDEEIHCDECMEVSHFHFENHCPVCGKVHAGTDQYRSVADCIENGGIFECIHCETRFKILQHEYAAETQEDALIEVVTHGRNFV
jgi:hypothetical protein